MTYNGREAALRALIACRREGAWSEAALKQLLKDTDRREAALASRLCYGVLQQRMLLDHWIDAFAKGKLQPVVRDILRLAVYQLHFMDKIPANAAVNEAVEQTKKHSNPQAARLVNGVLRSMLRAAQWPMPKELSIQYSHPEPLVALLVAQFGEETARALMQSHNSAPGTVLQVNTLKAQSEEVKASLSKDCEEVQPHPWLKDCFCVGGTGNIEHLPAYAQGWIYAQDAAAKMAVLAAGLRPGMRVLDCCAAPGGKSFGAAIAMENQGELISCDIHPHKLKLIEKGAERLGISILQTRLQDGSQTVEEWKQSFDAVLADVPCSGLGVIRKKPDIRYKDLGQRDGLIALQRKILSCQAAYVRPGGVLLYSTCTLLREENEEMIAWFLGQHPDYAEEMVNFPTASGLPSASMTTFLPCRDHTDGFFICKLRRKP